MTYKQRWESTRPGCLIFLLDQSGSMSDPFGTAQVGAGKRKCDMVATVLNNFLNELIITNTIAQNDNTTIVKPRADVAVVGYEGSFVGSVLGGALRKRDFVSLPELLTNPIDIEQRTRKEMDETGQIIEIPIPFPVWVQPLAGGSTPMCAALRHAQYLAQQWADDHLEHYPPVIINVTDGMATDGDPTSLARDIRQISTNDGEALLFNVHITDLNISPVRYPAKEYELPNDRHARSLFSMSSFIPDTSRERLQQMLGKPVEPGARGLIFNGDAASVQHIFIFATVPATRPLDQDR
ncbi:VWA domain-containing protein [Ktedonosporobacter rubrisoli]|uniref:VWA domain-containing protein n=1 Tax=Ktedonosporobacter rubrisoli TaxID=2509675 RepID=A0A4P6JYK1_KTERU|nr:VWA domain-containing protein [Ktedonosporobacter rubrisoli]QBD80784.1 VWA domain-containing protein [Ktedonosporobacter rubrisoli]